MDWLLKSLPGRVVVKFLNDQAPNWASLIAWNALFALFPIVLFTSSLLGYALRFFGQAENTVFNIIFHAFPGSIEQQNQLIAAVEGVKSQSGIFFIVGLIGLLWGGSALFGAMEQAFATIYHTKQRDFIQQKLVAFAMVFVFGALVLIAVLGSTVVSALKDLPHIPGVPSFMYTDFGTILPIIVGIIAGFLLFLSIYYVIPNQKQRLRAVLPGAVVSGVLFELITLIFPLFIALDKGINQYGATFALLFVLMTFLFFMGLITMLGVEVNSVLYPAEFRQPARGENMMATQTRAGGAGRRGPQGADPAANGQRGPARRGVKARTAMLVAGTAALVGVLLGRRSASS